jgi:hypothetical protein
MSSFKSASFTSKGIYKLFDNNLYFTALEISEIKTGFDMTILSL